MGYSRQQEIRGQGNEQEGQESQRAILEVA